MKIPNHILATKMCIENPYGTGLLIAAICAFAGALPLAAETEHDKLPGMGVQPVEYFYTGKPYDADSESYTFRYRNYDPELNRWTTVDPSGFPDGANNQIYAPSPTTQMDPFGLAQQNLVHSGQYTDEKTQHQELFISYQISLGSGQQTTTTLSASIQNPGATFADQFSNYEGHTATANNWIDLGQPTTTRNSGKSPGQLTGADVYVPQDWSFDGWVGSPIIDPTSVIFGPVTIGPFPGSVHLRDIYWFEQTTYSMSYTVVE